MVAVVAPIVFGIGGMIVGGLLGNVIAPANLTWTGDSTPGLLLVGLVLGLVGGVGCGIWAGTRIVRRARLRNPAPPVDAITRRRRRIAVAGAISVVVAGLIAFSAWPQPICEERERNALLAVPTFGDVPAPVKDMPIEEGATAPGGCQLTYTVAAPADIVAEHYAEELYRVGWRDALADLGQKDLIERLNDEPYRLAIDVWDYGHGDPSRDHLFYYVTITEESGARVRVEASVADRGHPYM